MKGDKRVTLFFLLSIECSGEERKNTREQCDQMLRLKVAQTFPKVATVVFTCKVDVFEEPKKSPSIWANFKRNLDRINFQKLPNLVTLLERKISKRSSNKLGKGLVL